MNGKKSRTCDAHVQNLMSKAQTVYNIESYFFLEKPEDEQFYQKRRRFKIQGLDNLNALETECDKSWKEGRNSIEKLCESMTQLIKRTTQEMQQRWQQGYEKMKRDLAEVKNHLDLYMQDPHFELSLEEIVLCESAPISPVLIVMLEDCHVSVAETLMANFQVQAWDLKVEGQKDWIVKLQQFVSDQMEHGAIGVAARAAEGVKQLGGEAPDLQAVAFEYNQETSQRFQSLFASSAEREALECLRAGEAGLQVRNFDKALEELKRGRVLLQKIDNIQLNLQLNNSMAETYCMAERWQDTVPLCEETLSTWGNELFHFELLRTLFYLTQAYYQLNQQEQGYATVEKWAEKLKTDSTRCRCIFLCIRTITLREQGNLTEAEQCYDEVLKLHQFHSYIIASSTLKAKYISVRWTFPIFIILGVFVYILKRMVVLMKKFFFTRWCLLSLCFAAICVIVGINPEAMAIQPCSSHPHQSEEYANCLVDKGNLHRSSNRQKEAELLYLQAVDIYSAHFPHSQDYAVSLNQLGILYDDMGKSADSEKRYNQCINIGSTHFPQSQIYADCLHNLGILYDDMGKHDDSEKRYLQAITIYSNYFPHSRSYDDCLENLGNLYMVEKRMLEGTAKLEDAKSIEL